MGLGMMRLPHSPQWLIQQDRKVEAGLVLTWLRDIDMSSWASPGTSAENAQEDSTQLEIDAKCPMALATDQEIDGGDSTSLSAFLRCPATWTSFWVMFFKQASGGVPIFYYKANILTALGFGNHVGVLTVLLISLRGGATFAGAMLAGHLGYRDSLLLGSCGATVSMLGMTLCPLTAHSLPVLSGAMAFALLAANIVFFEISFGTVSHQLAAELFPHKHRQRGIAWSHLCNYPLKGISLQIYPLVQSATGVVPIWTALAVVNVAGFLTVHHLVPAISSGTAELREEPELELGD
jgi:hypothetical protein